MPFVKLFCKFGYQKFLCRHNDDQKNQKKGSLPDQRTRAVRANPELKTETKPWNLDYRTNQINIEQDIKPQPASRLTDCFSGQVEWRETKKSPQESAEKMFKFRLEQFLIQRLES